MSTKTTTRATKRTNKRAATATGDSNASTADASLPSAAAAPTPAGGTPAPTSPPASPPGGATAPLAPPPAGATIPTPPSGATAVTGTTQKGIAPTAEEEAALSAAVLDVANFTTFASVFGITNVPYTQVVQCFSVANAWTIMRNQTAAWDAYSQAQEIAAWKQIRATLKTLKPVWAAAIVGDPSLAGTFPGLAALFAVKQASAKRAASTRRANAAALAAGLPASHGVVGKRRQSKTAKALLAASQSGGDKPVVGAPAPSSGPTATQAATTPAQVAVTPR